MSIAREHHVLSLILATYIFQIIICCLSVNLRNPIEIGVSVII